ncbi:Elongation of fatty acids protein 2 [Pyricularia oryzae]
MGIKQLFTIIKENAPAAIKTGEIKNQFGRKVAIDAYAQHSLLKTHYAGDDNTDPMNLLTPVP